MILLNLVFSKSNISYLPDWIQSSIYNNQSVFANEDFYSTWFDSSNDYEWFCNHYQPDGYIDESCEYPCALASDGSHQNSSCCSSNNIWWDNTHPGWMGPFYTAFGDSRTIPNSNTTSCDPSLSVGENNCPDGFGVDTGVCTNCELLQCDPCCFDNSCGSDGICPFPSYII